MIAFHFDFLIVHTGTLWHCPFGLVSLHFARADYIRRVRVKIKIFEANETLALQLGIIQANGILFVSLLAARWPIAALQGDRIVVLQYDEYRSISGLAAGHDGTIDVRSVARLAGTRAFRLKHAIGIPALHRRSASPRLQAIANASEAASVAAFWAVVS